MLVQIPVDSFSLEGELILPQGAVGLVLFVHGSGSSRLSPRNNFVAKILNQAKLSTLLIDLLSEKEDLVYETRFDIELLAERLSLVIDWLLLNQETKHLPLGLFGASTGAAAALRAAAEREAVIKAIVSRGGRPDLAKESLGKVKAPTLLIVGDHDSDVMALNEESLALLQTTKELKIVPGATHLFEEPGCLETVAELSKAWFLAHL